MRKLLFFSFCVFFCYSNFGAQIRDTQVWYTVVDFSPINNCYFDEKLLFQKVSSRKVNEERKMTCWEIFLLKTQFKVNWGNHSDESSTHCLINTWIHYDFVWFRLFLALATRTYFLDCSWYNMFFYATVLWYSQKLGLVLSFYFLK